MTTGFPGHNRKRTWEPKPKSRTYYCARCWQSIHTKCIVTRDGRWHPECFREQFPKNA